jgi:uncharacterized protein (DUF433 family)
MKTALKSKNNAKKLVRGSYNGEPYEYYPLGKHIVAAPGICGGRPTFKHTRLEVGVILSLIAAGDSIEDVVKAYSLSRIKPQAVAEAILLANKALIQSAETIPLT